MVFIENPKKGSAPFTSRKQADRYFNQGRVSITTVEGEIVSMRFIETDHRHISAVNQAKEAAVGYDTMPRRYLKLHEIRHIPCTQASNAYTLPTKSHKTPAGRTGQVEIVVKDGQLAWQEENVA